ncbi:hypothetical protein GCM10023063_21050 [Arthrobacter methylotrophus]|uniref:Uncharacterized protein n=2 Tax=Arthrobacter methylotrophus TaxID=121291 RepID=A0ABV5UVU8_9MICC
MDLAATLGTQSAPAAMQIDNNGTVDVNIVPSASTPMIDPLVGLGARVLGGGVPPASVAAGTMLALTGFTATGARIAGCGLLAAGLLLVRTKYILRRNGQQS